MRASQLSKWYFRRAKRRIEASYMMLAHQFRFLPYPKRLERYYGINEISFKSDHHDLFPRSNEFVELHALWVVDLITPSLLDEARSKVRKVNWDETVFLNEDNDAWMESSRRMSSGGWRSLGAAAPIGTRYFGSITRFRKFPATFDYATFKVVSVTPSLSAIVGCFFVKDGKEGCYEEILRSHHFSEARPNPTGSISLIDPRERKKEMLAEKRTSLRKEASDFMRRNFGGVLATSRPDAITSVEVLRMPSQSRPAFERFFFDQHQRWESEYKGVTWATSYFAPKGHSVMVIDDRVFSSIDLKHYGEETISAVLNRLGSELSLNWTFEAVNALITEYEKVIVKVRDSQFKPITSIFFTSRLLSSERTGEMSDIQLVSSELAHEDLSYQKNSMLEFSSNSFGGKNIHLREAVCKNVRRRAKKLRRHYKNVTEVRKDLNDRFAIFEMARMARLSLVGTIVSAIIAGVAVAIAWG